MAQAKVFEDSLERNIAFYRDTLIQIQCHNYNWEFEKVPHVVANMLIGDMRRILKCAIFLKENRILLLTDELDIPSRMDFMRISGSLLMLILSVDTFRANLPFLMLGIILI